MSQDYIVLAEIGAAHGIKGEVRVKLFSDNVDNFAGYNPLIDLKTHTVLKIAAFRQADGVLIIRFEGVNSRNDAELLRGHEIGIAKTLLPITEEDEFYHSDLIGLKALTPEGLAFGVVVAVHNFGADDLLDIVLDESRKSVLIPFTKAYVPTLDVKNGSVTVILPDGLI